MEFKQIWDTFVSIPKDQLPLDKKGKLDYVSWAHALHLAISHFPELTFNCDREATYGDGSMMVYASVSIGEHTREMWLPVMDYKNNSIINPSSRQVSDNKMRCLVKCIALFGLGLNVYAGEDLLYLDEKQEEKKPPPPKKKQEAKEPEEEPEQEPEQDDLALVAEGLKKTMRMHDTVDSLRNFWTVNKANIERMETEQPQIYADLLGAFKEYKSTLGE